MRTNDDLKAVDDIVITRKELMEIQNLLLCGKRNIAPTMMRNYVKRAHACVEEIMNNG